MCYLDTKETFEEEFGRKTFTKVIDDPIVASEHQAIISINNQNAVLVNKQTRVNIGLDKAARQETFLKMQVPVPGSLFNTIEIPFQTYAMLSIFVRRICCMRFELLSCGIKVPTLWYAHEYIIIKGCLWEGLCIVDLPGFELE